MVRDVIEQRRPRAVLIEGPADFNERIGELQLGHLPPIAIYSYVAWDDQTRQGAYYPLCEYSPEWQALQAAQRVGAVARFIDLPYALLARQDRRTHRYSDGHLRSSDYVRQLCEALEVENFNDAWDLLFEQDPALAPPEILRRSGEYGANLRALDAGNVPEYDEQRERFMAAHIRAAQAEFGADQIVIVTGSYHTSALQRLLAEGSSELDTSVTWPPELVEQGLALTPYSYERLDSLAGYDAGMPSPGFYHAAWQAREGEDVHRPVLQEIARRVRELRQVASTADLIAVESCAQALAALRGHARVWRRDLIDAVTAALVKDELHATHPFLLALQAVLRGGRRGQLAEGSPLPPLVHDIRQRLESARLTPSHTRCEVTFRLPEAEDIGRSRLLHRLRVLGIPGFLRTGGTDFAARVDLTELVETWAVHWTPEQDAALIEAARYSSALGEAVAARLEEAAREVQRSSAQGALLLLDAVLAGVLPAAQALLTRLDGLIHEDGSLASVSEGLGHLLYLFARDDALGTRGGLVTGSLLQAAFERTLWLLEAGGSIGESGADVQAIRQARDAFEQAEQPMQLDRREFAAVLARVQADRERTPAQRGACAGALWSLHCADPAEIRRDLLLFADPEHLGDFLSGVFTLAREEAHRDRELLCQINAVLSAWDNENFLAALPSLRLAFMAFTPREKVHLADRLFDATTVDLADEPVPLQVSSAEAAAALAFETRLFALAETYGVSLHPHEPA